MKKQKTTTRVSKKRHSINRKRDADASRYMLFVTLFVAGLFVGVLLGQMMRPRAATPREIENAKNQVMLHVADERLVGVCTEGGRIEDRMGKIVPDYRHIRINSRANRAIVTDCAERDELFVKTRDGFWEPTSVELQLSDRANTMWLSACLIDDIVVADEIVRSENSAIDAANLEECQRIASL